MHTIQQAYLQCMLTKPGVSRSRGYCRKISFTGLSGLFFIQESLFWTVFLWYSLTWPSGSLLCFNHWVIVSTSAGSMDSKNINLIHWAYVERDLTWIIFKGKEKYQIAASIEFREASSLLKKNNKICFYHYCDTPS